jgi:hypothetical protein
MKFNIIALAALLTTAAAQGLGDLPDCSVCTNYRGNERSANQASLYRKNVPLAPFPKAVALTSSASVRPSPS